MRLHFRINKRFSVPGEKGSFPQKSTDGPEVFKQRAHTICGVVLFYYTPYIYKLYQFEFNYLKLLDKYGHLYMILGQMLRLWPGNRKSGGNIARERRERNQGGALDEQGRAGPKGWGFALDHRQD